MTFHHFVLFRWISKMSSTLMLEEISADSSLLRRTFKSELLGKVCSRRMMQICFFLPLICTRSRFIRCNTLLNPSFIDGEIQMK